jgi:hypothetical protein
MVRENENDGSGHTPRDGTQNRRQLLATLTSTAIAGGVGTTSVTATKRPDLAASPQTYRTRALADGSADVEAVLEAVERTDLRSELESSGFSPQPDRAAVYAIETAELSDDMPAAVVVPLQATTDGTAISSEPLFGFVCAGTTADQDGSRVVSTLFGIEIEKRPSMFSWFLDEQYSATVRYAEDAVASSSQYTSRQTGSIRSKTVSVDHEPDETAGVALTADTEEDPSDACTICTLSSTLACQALGQLGPFLCELACRGNGICNTVCPVLTDIVGELLCENTDEFCELISACADDTDESGSEDESPPDLDG